jgi:hypothetical protein
MAEGRTATRRRKISARATRGVATHRRLWSLERPSVDVAGGAAGAGAPMAKGMFAPAKGGSCMPPFLLSHWRGHQWAAAVASWIWVISRMDLGLLQVIVAVMADPPLWLGVRAVRRCARAGRWPNRHPNVTSGRGLRSPRAATRYRSKQVSRSPRLDDARVPLVMGGRDGRWGVCIGDVLLIKDD